MVPTAMAQSSLISHQSCACHPELLVKFQNNLRNDPEEKNTMAIYNTSTDG